jgi:hypothetical protein
MEVLICYGVTISLTLPMLINEKCLINFKRRAAGRLSQKSTEICFDIYNVLDRIELIIFEVKAL